jgi:hypothetical protein
MKTEANARKVRLIGESRKKDDRLDAQTLVRMDPELLCPVKHRSEQAQVDLTLIRARAGLVRARTGLVNTARGLAKSYGERLRPNSGRPRFQRREIPMKATLASCWSCLFVFAVSMTCSVSARAQESSATDIDQLKAQMNSQQKLLEKQQAQIQALESALAEEQVMLLNLVQGKPKAAMVVPAVGSSDADLKVQAQGVMTQDNRILPQQQPLSPEAQKVQDELQRGPEIADVTPDTPALNLGPAKVRLIGYAALTGLYRTTNSGGNVGTSFASLPFDNTVPGNTSEIRLSAQSTRLALRADADLKSSKVAGYFEMDFGGTVPGNVAVSSTSYGFRIRQAWFDYTKGKWELTGGQLFTLMTPVKKSILPWPGDVSTTQVIDTNYVAGLVWGRYPQVRVVYHYSDAASFGFSIENPEQQVNSSSASGVVFPTLLAPTLNTLYNVGTNELKVPNMTPDFVLKGSFDGKLGGHVAHLDVGGVVRLFRNYAPYQGNGVSGHNYAFGGGGNVNASLEVAKGYRLVVNTFAGDGAGRYIGGLVPDVIVRANGNISPIKSYSWLSGFEIAPNKLTGLYVYYSGVYGQKNVALDTNGNFIGWGYPGASNVADRYIQEFTPGFSRTFWRHENLGSVQLGIQYAYLFLHPWVAGTGPSAAHSSMVLGQVRYNLP